MRKIFFYFILPVLFIAFCFGLFLAYNFLNTNFHTVIPGKIYRSAQFNEPWLKAHVKKYHIKTIINLRGEFDHNPWYIMEKKISKQQGVQHYDYEFFAQRLPKNSTLLPDLVNTIENAPKPILLHCKSGADRTGMASAVSLILLGHPTKAQIERQMTWRYNVLSSTSSGYMIFQNYFAWLKQNKKLFGKASFVEWVNLRLPMKTYRGRFY